MLRLRNASALVSEQWVSASQVQVSIFLPHYADDVLCKFLMELLSTSDLIFTQGAKQSKVLFAAWMYLNTQYLLKFIHEVEKKKAPKSYWQQQRDALRQFLLMV